MRAPCPSNKNKYVAVEVTCSDAQPPAPAPAPPAPPNPDEVRAQILEARNSPQATRLAELMNGGSRAVHARRTASDLVAQGARPRY